MKRSDFRHLERLRVRRAEVDLQKIVFNGHYLMYFDTAVAGYWRALALPYAETMAALGGDLYVRKATLDYLGSARYDEPLEVGMRCVHLGNSSLRFSAAVFRGERLLVHGELLYGVIVFFLQIDTLTHKNSSRDKHLQNWLSRTACAFGAD